MLAFQVKRVRQFAFTCQLYVAVVAGVNTSWCGRGDISTRLHKSDPKTARKQHESEDSALTATSTVSTPEKSVETFGWARTLGG